jgi:hypothetical protein
MTDPTLGEHSEPLTETNEGLTPSPKPIPTISAITTRRSINLWLTVPTGIAFVWIFFGTPFIIGVRMWHNSPIHPSFALFGAITFASVIAFVIVLTFDFVTGDNLSFDFAGLKFTGTSGPVTLWILAFSAVMAAFVLAGFQDMAKSQDSPQPGLNQIFYPASTPSPSPKPN